MTVTRKGMAANAPAPWLKLFRIRSSIASLVIAVLVVVPVIAAGTETTDADGPFAYQLWAVANPAIQHGERFAHGRVAFDRA